MFAEWKSSQDDCLACRRLPPPSHPLLSGKKIKLMRMIMINVYADYYHNHQFHRHQHNHHNCHRHQQNDHQSKCWSRAGWGVDLPSRMFLLDEERPTHAAKHGTNLKSNHHHDNDDDSFDDAGVTIESKSVLSGRSEDPMRSDGECKAWSSRIARQHPAGLNSTNNNNNYNNKNNKNKKKSN